MVGEAVLEQQQPLGVECRPLDGDGVELAAPGEGVVDVVDNVGHDEAFHGRNSQRLRGSGAADDPTDAAQREHPTRNGPQPEELSAFHRTPPRVVGRLRHVRVECHRRRPQLEFA